MRIDFEPIASVSDVEEVAAIIEIRTLFYGATYVADLDWDEDALLASFLDQLDDPATREDFAQERAAGVQEAKDRLLSEVRHFIAERHGTLAVNSPFTWRFDEGVLLEWRDRSELTMAGIGYLWMSFHWLLQSDKNYLIVEEEDQKRFRREFADVFEQICCYAISGSRQTSVWYLGSSRNVAGLLVYLRSIARACGSGVPKPLDQLDANQNGANDGGVDLIAIEHHAGTIRRNALALLVGATIQKTNRRIKIMGTPEINRFTSFFQKKPLLGYKGLLAVPFPRSPIEEEDCRDQDCLYFGREDIILNLGLAPAGDTANRLRHPGARLRRATETFIDGLVLASNDADVPLFKPEPKVVVG